MQDYLIRALTANTHVVDGITVTDLLKPPQMRRLMREYPTPDPPESLVNAMLGTAVHRLLADFVVSGTVETRLFKEYQGVAISGQPDVVYPDYIEDWKITSVNTNVPRPEWEKQLNLYNWLNDFKARYLLVTVIYKDWSPMGVNRDGYPEEPIREIFFQPKPKHEVYDLLDTLLEERAECTPEDMWEQPTKYAVMLAGKSKAHRVLNDESEALELAEKLGGYVVTRVGERTRCLYYCNVREHCGQFRRYVDY